MAISIVWVGAGAQAIEQRLLFDVGVFGAACNSRSIFRLQLLVV